LILPLRSVGGPETASRFPLKLPHQAWLDPGNPAKEWNIYLGQVSESAGLTDCLPAFYSKFGGADCSIDSFLRRHESTFGEVARLHIAAVLLACEHAGADRLEGDWYRLLSEEVISRDLQTVEAGKLSIISFNYDRSLERYLLNQFENRCDLSANDAHAALAKIRIEHVYGQLGTLEYVGYGQYARAHTASTGIRTIRSEPEEDVRSRIVKILQASVYINFIGFGFDDDNIDLLGPGNFKNKRVYSTTKGLSANTRLKIRQQLGVRLLAKDPPDLTAVQLLNVRTLFGPKILPRNTSNRPSSENRPSSKNRPRILRRPSVFQNGWDL